MEIKACKAKYKRKAKSRRNCGTILNKIRHKQFKKCAAAYPGLVEMIKQTCYLDYCTNVKDKPSLKGVVCTSLETIIALCHYNGYGGIRWRSRRLCGNLKTIFNISLSLSYNRIHKINIELIHYIVLVFILHWFFSIWAFKLHCINFCYIWWLVFLVPDSYWVTVRNCNIMSGDVTRGHHKKWWEWRLFLLFLDNFAVALGFLTLQDKHNIRTLSENIKFICQRCDTGLKSLPKTRFFYLLIKLVQINIIFSNNVPILSINIFNSKL